MDRRQKKTRQAIFEAFTRLMEKKSFSNITVREIIEEADVGRSTFYSHFETKDDLLKALCTDIFNHVFSEDLTRESTHDFSSSGREIQDEITHILYHLRDSGRYIRGIFSGESGEVFMRYFREYLEKIFEGELQETGSGIPRDYLLNHMVWDFAETVRWWMNHTEYTPEEISGFFFASAIRLS